MRFRADGRSMYPTIKDGEAITVTPVEPSHVKRGDIILCRFERGVVAHRVLRIAKRKASRSHKDFVLTTFFILRGDAAIACDEPVEPQQVLGKVISVERDGRSITLDSRRAKFFYTVRVFVLRYKNWMLDH